MLPGPAAGRRLGIPPPGRLDRAAWTAGPLPQFCRLGLPETSGCLDAAPASDRLDRRRRLDRAACCALSDLDRALDRLDLDLDPGCLDTRTRPGTRPPWTALEPAWCLDLPQRPCLDLPQTAWIAPETLRPCAWTFQTLPWTWTWTLPGPCLDLPGLTLCCRLDRPGTLPQCCLDLRPAWTAMPETLPQVCRPWTAWTLLPAPPWNRRPASDLAAWTALPWTAFRPLCLGPRCWTAASPYPGWTCRLRPASDLAA
jgi:hypothetical protein